MSKDFKEVLNDPLRYTDSPHTPHQMPSLEEVMGSNDRDPNFNKNKSMVKEISS